MSYYEDKPSKAAARFFGWVAIYTFIAIGFAIGLGAGYILWG